MDDGERRKEKGGGRDNDLDDNITISKQSKVSMRIRGPSNQAQVNA